jgi:hypothetical protein
MTSTMTMTMTISVLYRIWAADPGVRELATGKETALTPQVITPQDDDDAEMEAEARASQLERLDTLDDIAATLRRVAASAP